MIRLKSRLERNLAKWLNRRMHPIRLNKPIVSFTFDDFPRSALLVAGAMLREHGFYGTYYTSFGLMGKTAPTGPIFSDRDLPEFAKQGHELACHTYDHCHSWNTNPGEFEASIHRNQQVLAQFFPGRQFENFSYPISHPRPETKSRVGRLYRSARGGGQTFNSGMADLNFLKAFFIEQSRNDLDAIKRVIDANRVANGWLIFATHDVCQTPTPYGCLPQTFRAILKDAVNSGATVLPVRHAMHQIVTEKATAL